MSLSPAVRRSIATLRMTSPPAARSETTESTRPSRRKRRLQNLTASAITAVLVAGCGGPTQQTHLDTSPGAYPPGVQGSITGACIVNAPDNAPATYCQCILRQMEAHIPLSNLGDPVVAGEAATKIPEARVCE